MKPKASGPDLGVSGEPSACQAAETQAKHEDGDDHGDRLDVDAVQGE